MTVSVDGIGMTSARTRERLVQRLRDKGIADPRVLDAIRNTPRHMFVDEALASRAYEDTALPIGNSQTISQPWVVARMTEALLDRGEVKKVLEVGSGCGYQTAVLAGLVAEVYTIERLGVLLRKARTRLRGLGIHNVHYRHGDGFAGWPEAAPFDGIIVTAAPEEIPETLLSQLSVGGALIIPVGPAGAQELQRVERTANGFESTGLGLVSFVPMLGGRI
jgi:protein-L-isoaspartate(D-aspartate) O-methyltransferase